MTEKHGECKQKSTLLQPHDEGLKAEEPPSNSCHEQHSFLQELRRNNDTRFKTILSFSVSFAFGVLGWSKGQIGPAFLDILNITGTDLEKGSAVMTSYFVGRVLGSTICGALYSRINRYVILVFSMTLNSVMFAVIPWCAHYELMLFAHVLHGTAGGLMAVALISVAVSIWGATGRGRAYLNMFYSAFAVAGLLSPMATTPYLLQREIPINVDNSSWNISHYLPYDLDGNLAFNISENEVKTWPNVTISQSPASNLYIAYSISATIALFGTFPFVIFFFKSRVSIKHTAKGAKFRFLGNLSLLAKILQFINVGVFATVFNAIDFTFSGYLTVFCVQHLNWTKSSGSMLTSVLFFATLLGRIFGIFLVHLLQSSTVLMLSTVTITAGFIGLSVSAYSFVDAGVWISVGIIGFPMGIGWPSLLSWINEHFVPSCGTMTAYMMVTAFVGALLSPMLFGYMMEEISPIWFCYLSLGKSIINIVNVILLLIYSRFLHQSVTEL